MSYLPCWSLHRTCRCHSVGVWGSSLGICLVLGGSPGLLPAEHDFHGLVATFPVEYFHLLTQQGLAVSIVSTSERLRNARSVDYWFFRRPSYLAKDTARPRFGRVFTQCICLLSL